MKQTSFGTISGFGHPGGDKDFSRMDESDDRVFYATDRFVSHLDHIALETVEKIVDTLVIEKDLEERKRRVKATLQCPHCGEKLKKWAVPDNPFAFTWDNEFMYICFNDRCPYYIRGWDHMAGKGNRGVSYRLMYYPEKDICMPIPVPSPRALRESIVE